MEKNGKVIIYLFSYLLGRVIHTIIYVMLLYKDAPYFNCKNAVHSLLCVCVIILSAVRFSPFSCSPDIVIIIIIVNLMCCVLPALYNYIILLLLAQNVQQFYHAVYIPHQVSLYYYIDHMT